MIPRRKLASLDHLPNVLKTVFLGGTLARILLFSSVVNGNVMRNSCEFHGQRKLAYAIGAQWEVRVGSHKDFQCMNCTCLPEIGVRCSPSTTICPSLDDCFKIEYIPDSCCPKCTEVGNEPDKRSIRTDERKKSRSECHHNGGVYADGDRWSPEANSTSIKPSEDNQCVQCDCQNGKTICHLRGCTVPTTCLGPRITTHNNCCPVCQEILPAVQVDPFTDVYDSTNSASGGEDDLDPALETVDEEPTSECISGSEKYEEGAEWNPTIPPFGKMKCVVCRCESGRISCKRLECPPIDNVHCGQTVVKPGNCCPSCEETNEITNVSASGPYLCVRRGDYLVYENLHGGTVELALRLPEDEMISIHTWKVTNSNSEIASVELKLWEFRRDHPAPEGFRLVGIARSRRVSRFMRRILKIRDTCHQKCVQRIERLVEILRIRPAQSGRKASCPDQRFRLVDKTLI